MGGTSILPLSVYRRTGLALLVWVTANVAGCSPPKDSDGASQATSAVSANSLPTSAPATSTNALFGTWMVLDAGGEGGLWYYAGADQFSTDTEKFNGIDNQVKGQRVQYGTPNSHSVDITLPDGSVETVEVINHDNLFSRSMGFGNSYLRRCKSEDILVCTQDAEKVAGALNKAHGTGSNATPPITPASPFDEQPATPPNPSS